MGDQKKGTRVRKSDGQELEVVTFRLPAKLKVGLELLARLQGRSLTQSIEWALQYALVNVPANDVGDRESLWGVLNSAMTCSGWEGVLKLYDANPSLVSFEERHACSLVRQSLEHQYLDRSALEESSLVEYVDLHHQWVKVVQWSWPLLLEDANVMEISARQQKAPRHPLCQDLPLTGEDLTDVPIASVIRKSASIVSVVGGAGINDATLLVPVVPRSVPAPDVARKTPKVGAKRS